MINPVYLAGMFDASGYLSIRRRLNKASPFYSVRLVLNSTDEALLKAIQAEFGGTLRYPTARGIVLEWYAKDSIAKFLAVVQPHVISKRAEIDAWLAWLNGQAEVGTLLATVQADSE